MSDNPLRLLVIGAHPDDCEFKAAGVATLSRAAGHQVRFVSVTNGDAGHHKIFGEELAAIRRREAEAAGRVLDVEYRILDYHDGCLEPSLPARLELIAMIREFRPDLILTHRPNDYHPDHRYTSQLVCDAAYLVTVPAVVPATPALRADPVIMYFSDDFQRPYPFSPAVVVDIEPVWEQVIDALDCHQSQFYEWLPYNMGQEDEVPDDSQDRRQWLGDQMRTIIAPLADRHRELVVSTYGETKGQEVKYIEAFEPCEYGSPFDDSAHRRLFPFAPR